MFQRAAHPEDVRMKVFLFSSNLYSQFPAVFPNGVGALSAVLKEEGIQVETFHLATPEDLQRAPEVLRAASPDVVGFSCVSCEARLIEDLAAMSKQWKPQVPFLVGGIHAIVATREVYRCENVDGVCVGEGEVAFLDYLRKLEAGQDVTTTGNFLFKKGDEFIQNPSLPFVEDLDSLPSPDRMVCDLQQVIDANNGVINLMMSRGCPWNCRFCSNADIKAAGSGRYARMLSIDRAMDELEELSRDYHFTLICLRDDTFTWDRRWALRFAAAYKQRFDTPFVIFSRVDTLDEELIRELAAAGCKEIFLGLDSGSDHIRNAVLNKRQDNADLFKVTDLMARYDMTPVISNIVGLPHETPADHQQTVEINRRLHSRKVVFSAAFGACPKIWVFTPWPGSGIYHECMEQGWLTEEAGSAKVYRESSLVMPDFPPDQIDHAFRTFRYQVYKDNFPVRATLFRIYDASVVQHVFERIPLAAIGKVRQGLLDAMTLARPALRRGRRAVR